MSFSPSSLQKTKNPFYTPFMPKGNAFVFSSFFFPSEGEEEDPFKKRMRNFLLNLPSSIINQQKVLLSHTQRFEENEFSNKFPTTPSTRLFFNQREISYIQKGIYKTRFVRFQLRRLLHKWKFKKLRLVNTDDIATMEPPKIPIYLVDWNLKSKYIFEASTLMKDITERLLHCDGFFDEPLKPRNPLTNLPFTLSQKISIWTQLSISGYPSSSAFTNFRQTRYNLHKFSIHYSLILQHNALKKTMKDTSSIDYKERIIDFISYVYKVKGVRCLTSKFISLLSEDPNHTLLLEWQKLCFQFYESHIFYSNNLVKLAVLQESVLNKAYCILYKQKYL